MHTKKVGNIGERYAANYLQKKGYKVIARNFKVKVGEIDIIAQDGDTLVLVEVKTRNNTLYGQPEEAVNTKKIYRIQRAGEYFAQTHRGLPKKQRIEVIAIQLSGNQVESIKKLTAF